ncbi:MAG TPA: hypothetical protein VFM98_22515 [Ramlibacter sp.]|uniref:hypothetical protein n=1 Tax=Ramlibacter sp. TaxID=1917967 RepID=UPI002D7F4D40|nr:hypothetical protein [Ramlibacter sp.]HET8748387.1 hypothetical protein [Ramlibacter sp.]
MHTAICTFEDRAAAEQAAERLVQAGFDRHEIHVEHRHADGTPMAEPEGSGERRDQDVVAKFSFFERLFGAGKHVPHADTYSRAVEQGLYVVLVESPDEAQAQRAQDVLHGLNPADFSLVHRVGERPLRDVVAERGAGSMEQRFGTARSDMDASHNMDVRREGEFFPPERNPERTTERASEGMREEGLRERAFASQGWGEQRELKIVDEDKPIASPDIPAAHEEKDKPR